MDSGWAGGKPRRLSRDYEEATPTRLWLCISEDQPDFSSTTVAKVDSRLLALPASQRCRSIMGEVV